MERTYEELHKAMWTEIVKIMVAHSEAGVLGRLGIEHIKVEAAGDCGIEPYDLAGVHSQCYACETVMEYRRGVSDGSSMRENCKTHCPLFCMRGNSCFDDDSLYKITDDRGSMDADRIEAAITIRDSVWVVYTTPVKENGEG